MKKAKNYSISVCHIVPPSLQASDGSALLGVVTDSLTLMVIIDNASPSVRPNNIAWEYRSLTSSETRVVTADSRHSFSEDRKSLTISYLIHADEGNYTVTATNEAGCDTLQLTLNIEGTYIHMCGCIVRDYILFLLSTNVISSFK